MLSGLLLFYAIETITQEHIFFLYLCLHLFLSLSAPKNYIRTVKWDESLTLLSLQCIMVFPKMSE